MTENKDKLNEDKKDILPEDGIILDETTVSFGENENAYNLLKKVCEKIYDSGYKILNIDSTLIMVLFLR